MLLKIRIEIQLHDRATRHVDDKNPVIHAAPLTMARQLTWIMNGRLISKSAILCMFRLWRFLPLPMGPNYL